MLLVSGGAFASGHLSEAEMKAAFLFNFALLVEWPEQGGDTFPICVLGEGPVGEAVDTLAGKEIGGRAIVPRRVAGDAPLNACRILFISHAGRDRLLETLKRTGGRPVLTVSDHPGFVDDGGIIELFRQGSRMRFSVNFDAVYGTGLELGSQLLQMAHVVKRTRW